jgi:YHS domain-containing protein
LKFRRVVLAKDPVCGMSVNEKSAASSSYGAKTYYFCSSSCKNEFYKNPAKYVRCVVDMLVGPVGFEPPVWWVHFTQHPVFQPKPKMNPN